MARCEKCPIEKKAQRLKYLNTTPPGIVIPEGESIDTAVIRELRRHKGERQVLETEIQMLSVTDGCANCPHVKA